MLMARQLSGIAIILFIAFGSLTFILLFIFAKRQITRFALKTRHSPHVSIGSGGPKSLLREIDRRLDATNHIKYEPWLLNSTTKQEFEKDNIKDLSPPHLYRMKVVDDVKELCRLIKAENVAKSRHNQEDILHYFIRLHKNNVFLNIDLQVLYKFLSLYEHARYQDEVFAYQEYCQFTKLLNELKKNFIQTYPKSQSHSLLKDVRHKTTLRKENSEDFSLRTSSSFIDNINQCYNETTV